MRLELTDSEVLAELGLAAAPTAGGVLPAALARGEVEAVDLLTLRDLQRLSGSQAPELQALLLLLLVALRQGSLCLRLTPPALERRLQALTGVPQKTIAEGIMAGLAADAWPALCATPGAEYRPLVRRAAAAGDEFLYFHRTWAAAGTLRELLRARLAAPAAPLADDARLAAVLADVRARQPFPLSPAQQLALALALTQSFTIVSGGPGTGKTAIILALIEALQAAGVPENEILLAAPTGRAAQRINDSLRKAAARRGTPALAPGLAGRTIHRLLGYQPAANRFTYGATNLLPARVVIVDEVSMVDVYVMAHLLAALPATARLIFLGDKDQLPSVEAGAVLADLVPPAAAGYRPPTLDRLQRLLPDLRLPAAAPAPTGLVDHVVVLAESFRSQPEILRVAAGVNRQEADVAAALPQAAWVHGRPEWPAAAAGVFLVEPPAAAAADGLAAVLDAWAIRHYLQAPAGHLAYRDLVAASAQLDFGGLSAPAPETAALLRELFASLERAQILALLRQGPFGVSGINRHLDRQLRPLLAPDAAGAAFPGLPVIVERNDPSQDLFNGDLGVVVRGRDGVLRAAFAKAGGHVALAVESLPPHAPAFAITVHKSQGSEYDDVLLVLPPAADHPLLTREIVYTGLTRARRQVVVAGAAAVLAAAIRRRGERETGISLWAD